MPSAKPRPSGCTLIHALDMSSEAEVRQHVERLGDSVDFYKIGLELLLGGSALQLLTWLQAQGKQVFLDLKLFDVPETIRRAVLQLRGLPIRFVTVHGNDAMLQAAVEAAADDGPGILAVTVLTSLDRGDLQALGFDCELQQLVLSRAQRAVEAGCEGVISSGLEVALIRRQLGDRPLIAVPGIRPIDNNREQDDQKRVVGIREAVQAGADYLVIGRPIRDADNPLAAAKDIRQIIDQSLEELQP